MLVRSNNMSQSGQEPFRYEHLNQSSFGNHAEMANYNQIRMSQNYASSSAQAPSLLMPVIHESNDMLNCDLTQLQSMDDDEDYVEHDLGDSDDEMESDEDEESESEESDSEESNNFDKARKRKSKKSTKNQTDGQDKAKNVHTDNNSSSVIEKNFVTISQKDELSSHIQNGILLY